MIQYLYNLSSPTRELDFSILLIDNCAMSPFLDRETSLEEAGGQKYVFDGNSVYFAGPEDGYNPFHAILTRKFGVPKTDDEGRPFIAAAGKILNMGGKFSFSVDTTSCHIKGENTQKAVKAVNKAAKEILGEDKVC